MTKYRASLLRHRCRPGQFVIGTRTVLILLEYKRTYAIYLLVCTVVAYYSLLFSFSLINQFSLGTRRVTVTEPIGHLSHLSTPYSRPPTPGGPDLEAGKRMQLAVWPCCAVQLSEYDCTRIQPFDCTRGWLHESRTVNGQAMTQKLLVTRIDL